jgi:AcrR family transcriptional regulator
MSAVQRRKKVPRAEREARMLDVAMPLFAERGFHAVSVDEVAVGAGVTKPMVYAYFGSKEGLFAACVDRAAAGLIGALEQSAAQHDDPEQRMWHGLLTVFRFVDAHREAWRVLYGSGSSPFAGPAGEASDAMARLITDEFMDSARRSGIEAGAGPHMEPLAHAFVAATIGVARWWVDGRASEPAELQAMRLMNMHWRGFERMMRGDFWLPPPPGEEER